MSILLIILERVTKINRKIAAGRFALIVALACKISVITVDMTYRLKFISGSGGVFVWHMLICSPECAPAWAPHSYATPADWIESEVYRLIHRPWDYMGKHDVLAVSETALNDWININDHRWRDPDSRDYYAEHTPDVPADVWLWHTHPHGIEAWQMVLSTYNTSDLGIWQVHHTDGTLHAAHARMRRRQRRAENPSQYHCVDWIWRDFDEPAYVALCDYCGLTPVPDLARQVHRAYTACRRRITKHWLEWYEHTYLPGLNQQVQLVREHIAG